MNSFLSKLIRRSILEQRPGVKRSEEEISQFEVGKGFYDLKVRFFRTIRDLLLITLGIASASFGLESFLLPSNFIDGGATGISLLISEVAGIQLYYLLILVNLPFVYLGYRIIG